MSDGVQVDQARAVLAIAEVSPKGDIQIDERASRSEISKPSGLEIAKSAGAKPDGLKITEAEARDLKPQLETVVDQVDDVIMRLTIAGLTATQIGERLRMTPAAVRMRRSRLRGRPVAAVTPDMAGCG